MSISDNDDEYEEIPRSRFLTNPKIILYKLIYGYLGEMRGKTIKNILRREASQVSMNVTKLANNSFIKVNKIGRENHIRATELGIAHIQKVFHQSINDILDFFDFIIKLPEFDEKMHKLIELINSVLRNPKLFEEVLKNYKIAEKRKKWENYQRVYDRVEKGIVTDKLIEKVFDFCNKNPSIKFPELLANFEENKPQSIKIYYNLWIKISLEEFNKLKKKLK